MLRLDADGNFLNWIELDDALGDPFLYEFTIRNNVLTLLLRASDTLTLDGQTIHGPAGFEDTYGIVAHYSLNGTLRNFFTIGGNGNLGFFECEYLANNELLLVFTTESADSLIINNAVTAGRQDTGNWIVKMDTAGNISQSTYLKHTGNAGFDLRDVSDNGRFVFTGGFSDRIESGNFQIVNANQPNPVFLQDGMYLITDNNLTVLSLGSMGVLDNNTYVPDAIFTGNNSVLLTGSLRGKLLHNGDSTFYNTTGNESYVVKVNTNGTITQGMRTLGAGQIPQIQSEGIINYDNGDFMIYGEANNNFTIYGAAQDTLQRKSSRVGFLWRFSRLLNQWEDYQPIINRGPAKMRLYPNPVRENELHIEYSSRLYFRSLNYRITDLKGMKIQQGAIREKTIAISELEEGPYILTVLNGNEVVQTFKFLRE